MPAFPSGTRACREPASVAAPHPAIAVLMHPCVVHACEGCGP